MAGSATGDATPSTGLDPQPPMLVRPVEVAHLVVPLQDRTAALVVVGSRHRQRLGRMVLGGHSVRIVHDAAVPALVVPLPPNG